MLVICNGMPRSASTWSFNVVMGLLRAVDGSVYGAYNENVAEFLASAGPSVRHLALKCHGLDGVGRALAACRAAKVIYTWRRLSDTVVSFMRMFSVDFEHALAVTHDSLQLYELHRSGGDAILLNYERIVRAPLEVVREIERYLGLKSPAGTSDRVCEQNALGQMRERVSALDRPENRARLVALERTTYDPETLLNVNHIRDGGSGYGALALSPEQLARVRSAARDYGVEG